MDITEKLVFWLVGTILAVAVMLAGYGAYLDATSDKITLSKELWECTQTRMVPAGKVMVQQCVQYNRR